MKVQELLDRFQYADKDAEIFIALHNGYRPIGFMKEMKEFVVVFDQDTNKASYVLDVNIEEELNTRK